jgi:hypothetical protein
MKTFSKAFPVAKMDGNPLLLTSSGGNAYAA